MADRATETLTIDRLGHRGDGVAVTADGPVFAAGTLPGEVVRGTRAGDRLRDLRIVTPVTARVRPPCRHARTCGGCALQHADDGFVAHWKADAIRTALAAHGLEAPMRPIATSPPRSRRRATLAARRTKSGALVGFHARASDTIVPIPDCQLLHPELMACLPALEAITRAAASRKATLAITLCRARGGPDVAISGAPAPEGPVAARVAGIAADAGLARLTWAGEAVMQVVPPAQVFGTVHAVPPPGAFLQATDQGEAALLAAVSEAVGPAARLIDLFAGCGTFALPLAARAAVHAVEGDPAMVAALAAAARGTSGLRPVTTEARDLFRNPLPVAELRADAVVIDPPRAGAEAQARALAQSDVPRIAMVSCNPASFARDARLLVAGGYRVAWVQPVDQFRWSAHVELAALLTKDDITAA